MTWCCGWPDGDGLLDRLAGAVPTLIRCIVAIIQCRNVMMKYLASDERL